MQLDEEKSADSVISRGATPANHLRGGEAVSIAALAGGEPPPHPCIFGRLPSPTTKKCLRRFGSVSEKTTTETEK